MSAVITVVQCVNNLDLGGLERMVLTLARKLKDGRFRSVVCCIEDRGTLAEQAEREGIEVRALEMEQRGKWNALRGLGAILRERRPNVIHSHNFKPFYYAALTRMFGAADAHVHTRHGAFTRHHRAHWRYRWMRRWADELVTVSEDGRQQLARSTGLPPDRIGVMANGVDTEQFKPVTDKVAVRKELGLPERCLAVVVAARLSPEKDLETLLRAFAIASRAHPDAELWIVGDGAERERLELLSRELGLTSNTRFLGARSDVNRVLSSADVFALSSVSEGLSIALIEAAASGLPIVATKVGGNAEIANPPAGGRLVAPRNPDAFAAALGELLADPRARADMGRATRQRAVERFSLDQMASRYANLYEKLLLHKRLDDRRGN